MSAPVRQSGFIESLCLGLAHRWEPGRLFVALPYTAYFDESGTHGGSQITVMGSVLARADQWKKFQRRFDEIKDKHGFRIFHTKKFKKKNGDFRGWDDDQCRSLMNDMGQLTAFGLAEGFVVSLDNADYKQFYRGESLPKKGTLDSKYGICFRTCLYRLIVEVSDRKYRKKVPDLHLVLESGHPNARDAERIFAEVKKEFAGRGSQILRTITFAEKDECDPLMIADFLAHSGFTINRNARATGIPLPPSHPVPRGQAGITHIESTPKALEQMRAVVGTRFLSVNAMRASSRGKGLPS